MRIFNKREDNGVPGKVRIYKTIEKYRKPEQTGVATAAVCVLPDTEKTGIVGVKIVSFDYTPWFIAARLKDIYELHQEGKLRVVNMKLTRGEVYVNDDGLDFIFFKDKIVNPNLSDISKRYADDVVEYIINNKGF